MIPIGRHREIAAGQDAYFLAQKLARNADARRDVGNLDRTQRVHDRAQHIEIRRNGRRAGRVGIPVAHRGVDCVNIGVVHARSRVHHDLDAGFAGFRRSRNLDIVDIDAAGGELDIVVGRLGNAPDTGAVDHDVTHAMHHVEVRQNIQLDIGMRLQRTRSDQPRIIGCGSAT